MSLIKLQGNASGTGAFTIAAPNGNTDRTLTLPDATGTVLAAPAGAVTISSSAPSNSLTLDGSGSLGIGVTPSAWGSGYRTAQLGNQGASISGNTTISQAVLGSNGFYNDTNWIYNNSDSAGQYRLDGNVHKWFNAPSGTAGNAITFTQAMTLDASGRLGIGITSPTDYGAGTTTLSINGTAGGFADFYYNGTRAGLIAAGNGQFVLDTATSVPLVFKTQAAERARIDANGNLLVASTSNTPSAAKVRVYQSDTSNPSITSEKTTTSNTNHVIWYNPNGAVGSIGTSGSSTNYVTSSDYRLKEDWQPMAGASERVLALKPVNFAWKVDGSRVDGFLAHEAQEVVPEAVTGAKDEVDDEGNPKYQGIDQSKLVPLLTAALQEALAEIANLKTRLTALEAN